MTLVATPQAIPFQPSPTLSVASISSGTSSVWSVLSATSSNATSVASSTIDNFSAPPTTILPYLTSQTVPGHDLRRRTTTPLPRGTVDQYGIRHPHPCPSSMDVSQHLTQQPLPLEQRQNPRRTNRLVESAQQCPAAGGCVMPVVPSLQRQADRKVNFVENLVDSAAQIVETIWQPPKYMAAQVGPKDAVLPLRTFIQETLRRSRTSYSTLQVALYYLIVIRPHLPGMEYDVSDLRPEDTQLVRAKQCGRRMFLAALILASKYLQDRNYSARAWSKISGLNTQEINVNEMAFLKAVDWKLHISEAVFQKWTELVLKYTSTPSPSPVSPKRCSPWSGEEHRRREWCDLILRLSPDLGEVELVTMDQAARPLTSQVEFGPPIGSVVTPPVSAPPPATLRKSHSMPAPPRTLEPQLQKNNAFRSLHQPLPNTPISLPLPASLRRPSPNQRSILSSISGSATPAASFNAGQRTPTNAALMPTPKAGGSMACVARSAMSSALSGCSHEAYPAGINRRRPDVTAEPVVRRSSLSSCVTTYNESEPAPVNTVAPRPHRKVPSGLSRVVPVVVCVPSVISSPKILSRTPVLGSPAGLAPTAQLLVERGADVNTAAGDRRTPLHITSEEGSEAVARLLIERGAYYTLQQQQRMLVASPKSTEAAWTLNMLRGDAPSPATTTGSLTPTSSSIGRKRSCPSVSDGNKLSNGSSGVTPKLMLTGIGGSPSMRCVGSPIGSPMVGERCGKRARNAWGRETFDLMGVAQGVR